MLPAAPALLSTMTGWFQIWLSRWPITRAMTSLLPPGVKGTMRVTGLVG